MLNERNTLLEDDGIEEEILVEEECSVAQAVWGDIQGNIENQTDLQNALDAKQDSLTEAQLNAVNSGITSEKVTTYDGYADQIASKADQSALNAESIARGEADTALGTRIDNEALARQSADNGLQTQIDAITSKSDVVDVVANYAALQAYDTSALGNNDVIKVLDDETHGDALTYYRWSKTNQTWTFIGQEAPYYSKGQMDVKLAEKQDKLTAGANIQIQNGTISATDTKYTAGNGLNLNGTEFSADTDVLATKEDLESYYTKPETDNLLAPKLEAEVVAELPTAGTEGKLYLTPKAHTTSTATGNPIEATITAQAGQLESFQLDGDTFQQSYEGKNLFDVDTETNYFIDSNGNLIAGQTWSISEYIKVSPNTTYVWHGEQTGTLGGRVIWAGYDSSQAFISGQYAQANDTASTSFTTGNTTEYIRVGYCNDRLGSMQLELGTATSYEPFVGGQPSPSPDCPQPIQTVTGRQVVSVTGKNLFDIGSSINDYFASDANGGRICTNPNDMSFVEANFAGSSFTVTSYNTSGWRWMSKWVELSKNTDYRISTSKATGAIKVVGFNSKEAGTGGTVLSTLSDEQTFNSGDYEFYAVSIYPHSAGATFSNIQIELGSTATQFVPYSKHTYPLDLGSIELCKLGTYQDYIWKDGEDWKVHKATSKATFSDLNWQDYQIGSTGHYRVYSSEIAQTVLPPSANNVNFIGYCSIYTNKTSSRTYAREEGCSVQGDGYANTGTIFIYDADYDYSGSATSWKEARGAGQIYFVLKTATDTAITNTALIAQLEAIRTASLQNGANTITNTAAGSNLAGDMEIGYFEFNPTNRYDKFIWLNLNNNYEQIGGE